MYLLSLISAYLRRQLAPLLAALAVTLCTAMVIIVISVMGGFLTQLKEMTHAISGDLVIEAYNADSGFSGYEGLIDALVADSLVTHATPTIRTFGLINLGPIQAFSQVQGVDFASLEETVGIEERLVWSEEQVGERREALKEAGRYDPPAPAGLSETLVARLPLDPGPASADAPAPVAGAVTGVEIRSPKAFDGTGYDFDRSWIGLPFTLTVVPLSGSGTLGSYEPERIPLVASNDFKSGLYDVDHQTVMVPLGVLQRALRMESFTGRADFDPLTGRGGETLVIPGRVTQVIVKLSGSVDSDDEVELQEARLRVSNLVEHHWRTLRESDPQRDAGVAPLVYTWVEMHGQLIGAVQNEKGMVTFLFVVISGVAVVMVATTFYMIVLAKTRDIGVLRAI